MKKGSAILTMVFIMLGVSATVFGYTKAKSFFFKNEAPAQSSAADLQVNAPTLPAAVEGPVLYSPGARKKIKHLDINSARSIPIVGEIGEMTATVPAAIQALSDAGSAPIYLLIDSPGGSVIQGSKIVAAMEASHAPVYTVCLTLCASMAAIILEYGHERYMVDRSIVMFHPASIGGGSGELDKVVSFLKTIQRYTDKHTAYIADRSGMSYADLKNKESIELWVDAEDAVAQKFADSIVSVTLPGALDSLVSNLRRNSKKQSDLLLESVEWK